MFDPFMNDPVSWHRDLPRRRIPRGTDKVAQVLLGAVAYVLFFMTFLDSPDLLHSIGYSICGVLCLFAGNMLRRRP